MNSSTEFKMNQQDLLWNKNVGAQDQQNAGPAQSADKLVVKDLYKIFGDRPEQALELLKSGVDKERVMEQTGQIIGVHGASFSVRAGEIFVIMGLSGSGKSTLVRLLNRLIEPTAGQILIDGKDISLLSKKDLLKVRREQMSMVFQAFALLPNRTVLENVGFGLEISGIPRAEREARALKVLARVGLEKFADMLPSQLSGGMQQRVGLARALCVNPAVVLMDEAFSALDPLIRKEMQEELLRLQAAEQRTIVFISHDIEEALHIGNRIAIMKDGKVVQVGTPQELIRSPANDYVREFFNGVDVSRYLSARDLLESNNANVIVVKDDASGVALASTDLHTRRQEYGYVCNENGRFIGVVSVLSLEEASAGDIKKAILENPQAVNLNTKMSQLVDLVGHAPCPLPVIDDQGKFCGTVSPCSILQQLQKSR